MKFTNQWILKQREDINKQIKLKLEEFNLTIEVFEDWFSNFENEEQYNLALKIFFLIDFKSDENIQVLIKQHKNLLDKQLHKRNKNKIVLIIDNDNIDSSNKFSYDLSKSWDTLTSYKKSEITKEVINNKDNFYVFFNDTHGTGNQFIRDFENIVNKLDQENCAIISITMTQIAYDNFQNTFPSIALIQPSYQSSKNIYTYQDEQKLTSSDIELLEKLGTEIYKEEYALGYKNSALLIAYSHQCPNNTLPIIWANGINNELNNNKAYPWKPLFEYKKVKKPKIKTDILHDNYLTSIPPKNLDFVGRLDELKKINDNLKDNKLINIVNGIGGVGKSELAYEYFLQHKDEYTKVAFIALSKDNISLEDAFIIKFKEKFQLDSFDDIIKRLQEFKGKNLLLVDNLEKREDFEKLKLLNSNFDLLITTRLNDLDSKNQLDLTTLNDEDAKELFLSIYNKDEEIKDILDYLDNHPLFINLTTKSLDLKYISLEELREDIKNNTISKIDSKDDQTFQEHLHARFNKQFENVQNKELKSLLQILAIFPSVEIDFEVYKKLLDINQVQLQKLVHRGWLSEKDDKYKLHQIIKTYILNEHNKKYDELIYIFDNLSSYIDPYDSTIIASQLNHYIPIIDSFLILFKNKKDNHIAKLFDSLTYLYYSMAKYNDAMNMQNKSLKIREDIFPKENEFILKSYNLKAIIYTNQNKQKEAENLFKIALKISEEVLGLNHRDSAATYNNLGLLYKNQNKQKKAEDLFKTALKISEKVLGLNHHDTAVSYNNLGLLYTNQNKQKEAEDLLKDSLRIKEEVLGLNHPSTAISYNNLALLYVDQKNKKEAENLFKKSLKICEKELGLNHPSTATSYSNIASLYKSQNNQKEVENLYIKALKIREEVLGLNHPDTALSYYNLGLLYLDNKYCDKSKEYLLKAKNIYTQDIYHEKELFNIENLLKKIKFNLKKEQQKKKGKYCKEYKELKETND